MKKSFFIFFITVMLISCGESRDKSGGNNGDWFHLTGNAQGTTFSIKYQDEKKRDLSTEVKEIFDEMDQQLSTYVDSSLISRVNRSERIFHENNYYPYFMSVFEKSKGIWQVTDSCFNPLVFPIVEYWGFGKKAEKPEEIDMIKIHELLQFINYDSIEYIFDEASLEIIRNPKIKFDFNAIAQGYTVDIIAEFLQKKGIENFMIELGGETRVQGKNDRATFWNMGIEKPNDMNAEHVLMATIEVKNRSMATSGNYRKFYEKDGVRYSHTIDPRNGFPVQHSLLSATVFADDCASADAFATAFMVMGVEKTKSFIKNHPELKLDVYLIYSEKGEFKTWLSDGIKDELKENN